MEQFAESYTLYDLMDIQDYVYPIDGWLQDYEMESLARTAKSN